MPWSLLLENMLSQEYIDIPWDKLNARLVPRALLLLLVPGVVALLLHLLLLLDLVLVVVHQHHLGLHWLWCELFWLDDNHS